MSTPISLMSAVRCGLPPSVSQSAPESTDATGATTGQPPDNAWHHLAVTLSPVMGDYLDMANNNKANAAAGTEPNENYGREMMELFTLGADRGYTERDVRQQARALTGFRNSWIPAYTPNAAAAPTSTIRARP